jgi:ligand-binding sensor domain-containing protein
MGTNVYFSGNRKYRQGNVGSKALFAQAALPSVYFKLSFLFIFCFLAEAKAQKALSVTMPSCPGGIIQCLSEDYNHLLLAGTRQGLFQFDGQVWDEVTPDSARFGSVSYIGMNKQSGQCALGNDSGKVWIQTPDYEWVPRKLGEYRSKSRISGIMWDKENRLWIASYGNGLFIVHKNKVYNLREADGLPNDQIYDISIDGAGRCWAATDAGLVSCYWTESGPKIQPWTTVHGLPDIICFSVEAHQFGNIYTGGYEGGISKYSPTAERFFPLTDSWSMGSIQHLKCNCDGRIFAGVGPGGVARIDEGNIQQLGTKSKITAQHTDREGNLWTAYQSGELTRAFTSVEVIDMPEDLEALAVALDAGGNVWIGSQQGLHRYDVEHSNWQMIDLPQKLHIISMLRMDNVLSLGTFGKGVFRYNLTTGQIQPFARNAQLPDQNILSLTQGKPGILVATLGGLALISTNMRQPTLSRLEGLPQNYVYQALPDNEEGLWIASDDKGLYHYGARGVKTIAQFKNQSVYSLYLNKDKRLWVSTEENGLFRETDNGFTRVPGFDAAPFISLEGDSAGNVFAIGNQLANWYSPDGKLLLSYDEQHGMPPTNTNLNATMKDKRGRIWAAVGGRVLCVWPFKPIQQTRPQPFIKEVNVMLEPVDEFSDLALAHNRNHLSVNYGSNWFQALTALGFRYRLIGYNDDWVYSLNDEAIFPKLLPGKYTFELQSGLHNYFEDSKTISFDFTVNRPWWQNPLFIVLVLALGGALVWLILKLREQRLKKIARLEQDRIRFQLEMLRQQINPHFLFNSMNTLLDLVEEGQQQEAVDYIERLSDLFRTVLTLRDQTTISLEEEIVLARKFYALQKNRFGENLQVNFDINPGDNHIPPLTLQLLIENAIKHNEVSRAMPLVIDIYEYEQGKLTVRNNLQRRRSRTSSTGTGLHNIFNRYEVLTGVAVEVIENTHYFMVKVPLIDRNNINGANGNATNGSSLLEEKIKADR